MIGRGKRVNVGLERGVHVVRVLAQGRVGGVAHVATGVGVHVVRVQEQAGGRGQVGRAQVVRRAGWDGHV